MGEIRFVGTGETRGYPYLVCKKKLVGTGETRGYPYLLCKKYASLLVRLVSLHLADFTYNSFFKGLKVKFSF